MLSAWTIDGGRDTYHGIHAQNISMTKWPFMSHTRNTYTSSVSDTKRVSQKGSFFPVLRCRISIRTKENAVVCKERAKEVKDNLPYLSIMKSEEARLKRKMEFRVRKKKNEDRDSVNCCSIVFPIIWPTRPLFYTLSAGGQTIRVVLTDLLF